MSVRAFPQGSSSSLTSIRTATISNPNYAGSASDTLVIGKAASTVTVSCPATVQTYSGSALEPCSATVTGANLSLTPTPTYTNNVNAGTATASYSFAGDANNPATRRAISGVLTHPDFNPKPDANGNIPSADVGVAILKEPVNNLPLMPLPPLGFLDALDAAGALRSGSDQTKFTVVGYGTVLGDNPSITPWPPDGLRRVAQSEFRSLHGQWLFLNQNPVQDLGGSGTGDSGGPVLWTHPLTGETTLVAITSRGNESFGNKYRVDTAEALDFLDDVLGTV